MATANVTSIRKDEVTLTLTLVVRVATPDDKEYFLLPSGEIQPGFIADCFDMLEMIKQHLVTINGKTYQEYHQILQGNAQI
jgi:hypothetical protein